MSPSQQKSIDKTSLGDYTVFTRSTKGGEKVQSQYEKELLRTLKSIDGTLKKIEKSINNDEKHHLNICNAVSHALKGERYTPIQSDDSGRIDTQI